MLTIKGRGNSDLPSSSNPDIPPTSKMSSPKLNVSPEQNPLSTIESPETKDERLKTPITKLMLRNRHEQRNEAFSVCRLDYTLVMLMIILLRCVWLKDLRRDLERERKKLEKAPELHGDFGTTITGLRIIHYKISMVRNRFSRSKQGGNVAPLGSQAVTKIHEIFDRAKKSKKGLLLFIDEADAFCCQPGDLDSAITDRIDEVIEFPLPQAVERFKLLKLYLNKYISGDSDSDSDSKWGSLFKRSSQTITIKDLSDDAIREAAQKTEGFSG
ncbi:hypothetical protein ACSBR1_025392 [Camellia fascicularis]